MAFKKTTRSLDFADLAMANCLEQNRSINQKPIRHLVPTGGLQCAQRNENLSRMPV